MRGGKRKNAGRPKGIPNKDTKVIRDAFQLLIENNIDKLDTWLGKIARADPSKAFDIILKLGEYVTPKLSRTEVTDVTSLEEFMKMTPDERRERIIEINHKLNNQENGKSKKRA